MRNITTKLRQSPCLACAACFLLLAVAPALADVNEDVATLIKGLEHQEEGVRKRSADALGYLGPDAAPAVEPLAALLKDEHPLVRGAAARALGRIGQAAAPYAEQVAALLKDEDKYTRGLAAVALGRIGVTSETVLAALVAGLEDKDTNVREESATALGDLGPDAAPAAPALVKAMSGWDKERNRTLALRAAYALYAVSKEPVALEYLISVLNTSEEAEHRALAAESIGWLGQDAARAIPALLESLNDSDEFVRSFSVQSLGRIGQEPDTVVPELVKALHDPHLLVQGVAIVALGNYGTQARAAKEQLELFLEHENEGVRMAAQEALDKISGR